jgi:hypothetical protein
VSTRRWYWAPNNIRCGGERIWVCSAPEVPSRLFADCGHAHYSRSAAEKHCVELNRPVRAVKRAARERRKDDR